MRERSRKNRSSGFSLLEVTISIGLMGFGLLTVAAMQVQSLAFGASGRQYREAVEIARDQMERAQLLPWDDIAPTGGFTAPPWIAYPGHPAGDVPISVDLPGSLDGAVEQVYTVHWRVTDANVEATLRDIDVRVTWMDPTRSTRTYAVSTVRSR
jgi:Tfp pilus assembly protein PilV